MQNSPAATTCCCDTYLEAEESFFFLLLLSQQFCPALSVSRFSMKIRPQRHNNDFVASAFFSLKTKKHKKKRNWNCWFLFLLLLFLFCFDITPTTRTTTLSTFQLSTVSREGRGQNWCRLIPTPHGLSVFSQACILSVMMSVHRGLDN